MKKSTSSLLVLILALALLVTSFASCSLSHTHTYRYSNNSVNHWSECEECHEKRTEEPHTFHFKEEKDATCNEVGQTIYECSVCGYQRTDYTPKLTHNFVPLEGTDKRECKNCHKTEDLLVEIPESERSGYTYLSALAEGETYLRVYQTLSNAFANRDDKASVNETIDGDAFKAIYHCVISDHPEYFWVDPASGWQTHFRGDKMTDVDLYYLFSAANLPAARAAFNEGIDKILAGVSTSMTAFEKELYIHDAIVKTNVYDETKKAPFVHSAYGALVLQCSVCDGYTKLFHLLMMKCGIPTMILSGYSGENHSWNAVNLDGDWYMVDLTWDDPVGQRKDVVLYTYFNLPWEAFSFDHAFVAPDGEPYENYYAIPSCTSDRYNYFKFLGYEGALNIDTIERVMRLQMQAGETKQFQIRITGLTGAAREKNAAIQSYLQSEVELYSTVARVLGKRSSEISLYFGVSSDGNILRLSLE